MIIIGKLGQKYEDGVNIFKQQEMGDCMYIVQKGIVDVFWEGSQGDILLSSLGPGEVFGEMALFTRQPRSATVRARGKTRVLTIDKRGFLKRVHEDPSLAFRILKQMSERILKLDQEMARLKAEQTA